MVKASLTSLVFKASFLFIKTMVKDVWACSTSLYLYFARLSSIHGAGLFPKTAYFPTKYLKKTSV